MRILLLGFFLPALALAQLDEALKAQLEMQQQAADIQRRIDALDDDSRRLLEEYRTQAAALDELQTYIDQVEKLLADQEQEIAARQRQLAELETLKRSLFPFLLKMLSALEQIVQADTPFLPEERKARLATLRETMNRADVNLAEKYRRLMEAYRIEAQYGHNLETYEGPLPADGDHRTVRFLRFGRVGLYYLTLDGHEGGVFDPKTKAWQKLEAEDLRPLEQAMRIAAKQAPPDLITLPVPAPEAP
ncbi:MAG: DUF3450 domain-containing protein [Methylohalobius sp.]|nr:DUF3450 domain-containing protein [Methylohalobius sp.]